MGYYAHIDNYSGKPSTWSTQTLPGLPTWTKIEPELGVEVLERVRYMIDHQVFLYGHSAEYYGIGVEAGELTFGDTDETRPGEEIDVIIGIARLAEEEGSVLTGVVYINGEATGDRSRILINGTEVTQEWAKWIWPDGTTEEVSGP